MNETVIANAHVEGDNSGGLSIYFPLFKEDYNSSLWYAEIPSPYEELMFARDTNWDDFLRVYLDLSSYLHPCCISYCLFYFTYVILRK